eukprot:gene16456-biopygen17259
MYLYPPPLPPAPLPPVEPLPPVLPRRGLCGGTLPRQAGSWRIEWREVAFWCGGALSPAGGARGAVRDAEGERGCFPAGGRPGIRAALRMMMW